MALDINWSPKAIKNLDTVIAYLEEHWTEREIGNFLKQVIKTTAPISESPYLYKTLAGNETLREAIITKHNLLIYRISTTKIELLAILIHDSNLQERKKYKPVYPV